MAPELQVPTNAESKMRSENTIQMLERGKKLMEGIEKKKNMEEINKDDEEDDRDIYQKKQYIDSVAIFIYSFGCSLLHFTMFLCSFAVKEPDLNYAKLVDTQFTQA